MPPSSCSPHPLPFSAPRGTRGHEKGHQSSNGWRRGPIPLVRGPRVHRCSEGGGSEMEAGVGRGQRGGQRCTSCMLGNAALFFPLHPSLPPSLISTPLPISFCKCGCTHLACARAHAQTCVRTGPSLICFCPQF